MGLAEVGIPLISAIGQNAQQRTQAEKDIRAGEESVDSATDARDNMRRQMEDYIAQLRNQYSDYLSGALTPGETKARESLGAKASAETATNVEAANKRVAQNLARAGATGGTGPQSVASKAFSGVETDANKQLMDYLTSIDEKLNLAAAQRQENTRNMISQLEANNMAKVAGVDQQIATMSGQVDTAKNAFGKTEIFNAGKGLVQLDPIAQKAAVPLALSGAGSVAQAFGNPTMNQTLQGVSRQASINPLLQPFGLNTSMFAQPSQDVPKEVGGTIYKPVTEVDMFGNKTTKYVPSGYTPEAQAKLDAAKVGKAQATTTLLNTINTQTKAASDETIEWKQAVLNINTQIDTYNSINGTSIPHAEPVKEKGLFGETITGVRIPSAMATGITGTVTAFNTATNEVRLSNGVIRKATPAEVEQFGGGNG